MRVSRLPSPAMESRLRSAAIAKSRHSVWASASGLRKRRIIDVRLHSWMVASLVVSQLLPAWNSPRSFSLVNAQHVVDVKIYHDGNRDFNSFSDRLERKGKNACCLCSCCVMRISFWRTEIHARDEPPRQTPRRRKKELSGLEHFLDFGARTSLVRLMLIERIKISDSIEGTGCIFLDKTCDPPQENFSTTKFILQYIDSLLDICLSHAFE